MKKEILFSYFPKLSHTKLKNLVSYFSSFEHAWEYIDNASAQKMNWSPELIEAFFSWKKNISEEKIQSDLERYGIHCVLRDDHDYPPLLKHISDPPLCLFVRGNLSNIAFPLGVVGTRKITPYGKIVTERLIEPLVHTGITIVSGLALGIDGLAHNLTLKAKGRTIAVLGGGVDTGTLHPSAHEKLAEKIIEHGGAIISEYPPGTVPFVYSFPKRNRIIAGMTLGTLVIEAGEKSGSLITAQCALDYNREVFAVPQNITSESSLGTNHLIKMGAKVVTQAEDILEVIQGTQKIPSVSIEKILVPQSPEEQKLLVWISHTPIHIDEVVKNSGIESRIVSSTLTLMEMRGDIKNIGGMMYITA